MIRWNTLLPYYEPFLPAARVARLREEMAGFAGSRAPLRVGKLRSDVASHSHLLYCPACLEADRERYAEAYWHRVHQVPGVFVCPFHGTGLWASPVARQGQASRTAFTTLEEAAEMPGRPIRLPPDSGRHLRSIAEDTQWLLESDAGVRSDGDLGERYIDVLAGGGWMLASQRVMSGDVRAAVVGRYGAPLLQALGCGLLGDEQDWLLRLLRRHRSTQAPLRHLLLIRTLGLSANAFLASPLRAVGECVAMAPGASRNLRLCILCREEADPPGAQPNAVFRCPECGATWIQRGGARTVLVLGGKWEARIRKMAAVPALSVREAARMLGIRISALQTIVRRLEIGRPDWVLPPWSHGTLLRHRTHFAEVRSAHPDDTRLEARRRAPAAYNFLWRHDPEWLDTHMPAAMAPQPRRVDWAERDERRLADVMHVVAEIRASEDRPERVARATVMSRAGFSSGERQQVARLPRTSAYLQEVEESLEAFAERRVRWVAQKIRGSGAGLYKPRPAHGVSVQRLVHEANLTPEQAAQLADLLRELADPPDALFRKSDAGLGN
jgi:hypothetical protein